jgi:hypothetical protein
MSTNSWDHSHNAEREQEKHRYYTGCAIVPVAIVPGVGTIDCCCIHEARAQVCL